MKIKTIDDLIFELSTYPGNTVIETPVEIAEKRFPVSEKLYCIEIAHIENKKPKTK